ncbi:MAG: hypothetical protein P1V51_06605 [Deltaproteobacteria bacterium]|nr:hypothetical protein [Deltaproteobacteria bacterium]
MKKPRSVAGGLLLLLLGILISGGASGCAFDRPRDPQPDGTLRLPGALGTSGDGRLLYVVGTNFDAQYGTGALQAYDLEFCDTAINGAAIWPVSIDPADAIVGEVQIGSFGGQLARGTNASGGERLFVPLRGTGTVAAVDVDATTGALRCVLPEGTSAGEIGAACDRVEVALELPNGNLVDDPYGAVAAGEHLWVSSLTSQFVDPEDPEGEVASYFARLGVDAPVEPTILSANRMMPRELRLDQYGRIWAVGQAVSGSSAMAELRVYDPASFALGLEGARNFSIAGAAGGGEARGLRFSTDGEFLYVITRRPDRLLIFGRSGSFGTESLTLRGSVSLPSSPAALERLSRPAPLGDLVVVTGNDPDALVVIDPQLQEIVGLLDGTHCDASGVCPQGSRRAGERAAVRDPGERPFGVLAVPQASGYRLWVSTFGLASTEAGGLLAIDLRDPARPWELTVVAEIATPVEEAE